MVLPSREISVSLLRLRADVAIVVGGRSGLHFKMNRLIILVVVLSPGVIRILECVRRLCLTHIVREVVL